MLHKSSGAVVHLNGGIFILIFNIQYIVYNSIDKRYIWM